MNKSFNIIILNIKKICCQKICQVTFIFRGIFCVLVEVLYLSTVCQPNVLSAVLTAAAVLAATAVFEAAVFVLAAVVFVLEAAGFGE